MCCELLSVFVHSVKDDGIDFRLCGRCNRTHMKTRESHRFKRESRGLLVLAEVFEARDGMVS